MALLKTHAQDSRRLMLHRARVLAHRYQSVLKTNKWIYNLKAPDPSKIVSLNKANELLIVRVCF